MDIELLISKVKENSVIYDFNDANHRNWNYIAFVWGNIGKDLGYPDDQVREKWHQLRSNYMRVKRNEKLKTFNFGRKPRWLYYKSMSFLDKFIETREIQYEIEQPENDYRNGSDSFEETYFIEIEHTENEETSKSTTSRKTRLKRKKESTKDEIDLPLLPELKKVDLARPEESDSDRLFLLSLLPSVKQLTPADNMDFRLHIQQFLKDRLFPINTSGNDHWWEQDIKDVVHDC